jgi:hypothetical protein
MKTKICTKCAKRKNINDFYMWSNGKPYPHCKKCHADIAKKYRQENKNKVKATRRKYEEKNKEKIKDYKKKYQQKNKERLKKKHREYQQQHPDECRLSRQKARKKLKQQVIIAYGGECQCCGESMYEFLTIDHIHNDGAKHRRDGVTTALFYTWLKQHNYPKRDFQCLCWNCNEAKAHFGKCPHQT